MTEIKRTNGQAGFSLIELLLVIGFIAAALVLAFVTYPKVQATNRANVESQNITIISGGIKNLYSTARNFGTLNNQTLVNAKIIPDVMSVDPATFAINNVWAGQVTIAPDPASNLRYTITYSGVPSSECVKLSTGVSTNFLRLVINGNAPVVDRLATGGNVDIDPAVVTTQCNAANGATNTLVFTGN